MVYDTSGSFGSTSSRQGPRALPVASSVCAREDASQQFRNCYTCQDFKNYYSIGSQLVAELPGNMAGG